ncbi:MAG: tetratricopeptide repeat protein, partial [Acidobacteriota bacterium]
MDLSEALEQTGQYDEAEKALERAFEMQPYSPLIRWQAGNYFLRRSNPPKMYECFKTACRFDTSKLGIAIETAWKSDPDRETILQKLIPDDLVSN